MLRAPEREFLRLHAVPSLEKRQPEESAADSLLPFQEREPEEHRFRSVRSGLALKELEPGELHANHVLQFDRDAEISGHREDFGVHPGGVVLRLHEEDQGDKRRPYEYWVCSK